MKKLLVFLSLCMATGGLYAQSSRMQYLESARNFVIQTKSGAAYHYLVHSQQTYKMQKKDGLLTIAGDEFNVDDIKEMRFVTLQRYVLSEDSTTFSGGYTIDHGLLAFRRSMTKGQWNTLVVPFSLTGRQVLDAFGEGTLLAEPRGVTLGDVATVEFDAIALDTDAEVIAAGMHYLIKPTREPDVAAGSMTNSIYAGKRIDGPVYVIPNVSMQNTEKTPSLSRLRSTDSNVFFALRGTYQKQTASYAPTLSKLYTLDDSGQFVIAENGIQLQAFRSWLELVKNTNNLDIRFYINGVDEDITGTSGLRDILIENHQDDCIFDLSGRRIAGSASQLKAGIYIINGKKVNIK